MNDLPELMTKQEVADYLRVSLRTVTRLHLPRLRIGRYLRSDIADYVEASKIRPQPKRAARRAALYHSEPGDAETRIAAMVNRLRSVK